MGHLCILIHVDIDDIFLIIYNVYPPSLAHPVPMNHREKY